MTRAQRRLAGELRSYLGSTVGERRSFAEIARELPTLSQRTPVTKGIVNGLMADFVAQGLAEASPGPRGGAGWALTAKGAKLVAKLYEHVRAGDA